MVEYANQDTVRAVTIKGVVCPECNSLIQLPLITGVDHCLHECPERYIQTAMRRYFGWCLDCKCGAEVIQFQDGDLWRINQYRMYRQAAGEKPTPITGWIKLNELPQPAPVVTGPGGCYDKPAQLTVVTIPAASLKAVHNVLQNSAKVMGELLRALGINV